VFDWWYIVECLRDDRLPLIIMAKIHLNFINNFCFWLIDWLFRVFEAFQNFLRWD
jgi:hypothetical protein